MYILKMLFLSKLMRSIIISLSIVLSSGAFADTISFYTVSFLPANPDRGACINMVPAIPGTGYACLYKKVNGVVNETYKDMNALLLAMYVTKSPNCVIEWTGDDINGHKIIGGINCS